MKEENKFVAQLFHYLFPFIDAQKDVFLCIDGASALKNSGANARLLDPDVPDLWFTFLGNEVATGIEAKIINGTSISVRQNQLQAWKTTGKGAYPPKFWVAGNVGLSEFYCWHHRDVLPKLDGTISKQDNVSISMRGIHVYESKSAVQLARYILTETI